MSSWARCQAEMKGTGAVPERFLDSNVLLYSIATDNRQKQSIAIRLVSQSLQDGSGIISTQVVQECMSVVTRRSLLAIGKARAWLKLMMPLCAVYPSEILYERTLDIHDRYGFSFYDACIVAAALIGGCTALITEDLQHGQIIEGLTINNPFI